ncbi:MAG: DUF3352 domain-containing protein [Solirubrobacterales bacterium]
MARFPSLGDIRYALRRRTRRVRYALEDASYVVRRRARRMPKPPVPSAPATGGRAGLTLRARQRIVAAAATVVAVLAIVLFALVPNLPCWAPGGGECQPEDAAIELVPADSTAYAHVATDPDTEQYERAAALADRLPTLTDQIIARLPGPSGAGIDYGRDVAPWLGGEAALALVPSGGGAPKRTALLEVGDERGANEFVDALAGRDPRTEVEGDFDVTLAGGGLAVTQVSGFVVVGPHPQVSRVIDTEGGGRSLDDVEPIAEVRDAFPEPRLAELYVSEEGADELLAPGGSLGSFEAFVNAKAALGAGAAVVAGEDGLELHVNSVLDPDREQSSPGFFAAFPDFEPALGGEVSEGALAYVALGDPAGSVEGLLSQAAAEAPALASAFEDAGRRLREAGRVSIEKEILPVLTSQAAVSVEPRRPEGTAGLPGIPFVSLIVEEVDEERATRALARLQAPIAKALDPGRSLQAPVFRDEEIDGVTAHSLRISPTVELTYAVVDGRLVVSSDPLGVRQVRSGGSSLEDSDRFESATEGFPGDLSALLYLNLGDLVTLAESAGLGADPAYAVIGREVRELEGLGVAVDRDEGEIATEVRLTVGE